MRTLQQILRFGSATATVDTGTGVITSLRHGGTLRPRPGTPAVTREFFVAERAGGLLEYAVPLPDFPAHSATVGQDGAPTISTEDEELILDYPSLRTGHSHLAIQTTIRLRSDGSDLILRATVENRSEHTIPQLAFPQLLGLAALDDASQTRVQLARTRVRPFVDLATRVDDLWWVDHKSQRYIPYGFGEFAMKWLDYGDEQSGLTLYGTDTRYTTQGLVLDVPQGGKTVDDAVDIRWVHYPFIEPGETWDSGDYVLTTHDGDWYAGARSFAEFARPTYPYRAPQRIRDALAIRSVWPAVRSSPPMFRFAELVDYAEEVADPSYGIVELVLWHWWLKNGLPMIIDERLGTRQDLEHALAQCADLGVKVCMFVSHNIVRDTDESPPEWRHLNAAGQPVQDNWTYGYGMLPRFRAHHIATHAMLVATPLSKSWRAAALREYKKILSMGGTSIMFDVFRAPIDPEFNPAADGRPDESGVRLIELADAARTLIHEHDPEGAFAGEFSADVKMPYLDYTWEWVNAYAMEDSAPFRYVFPACRLNANVAHPRAAVIAFADGALLNLMPGGMRTERLADHPELATTVRHLAELRRRYLSYFTEGQYRFREGLQIYSGDARVYTVGEDRVLLIMINPTDNALTARVRIDPLAAWGGRRRSRLGELTTLDGRTEFLGSVAAEDELTAELDPDGLAVIELRSADDQEDY